MGDVREDVHRRYLDLLAEAERLRDFAGMSPSYYDGHQTVFGLLRAAAESLVDADRALTGLQRDHDAITRQWADERDDAGLARDERDAARARTAELERTLVETQRKYLDLMARLED